MWLICLFLFQGDDRWVFQDTGVYDYLHHSAVAVSTAGDLFIADQQNAKVSLISSSGKIQNTFVGRGQGPGEVFAITAIQFFEDRLYVMDYFQKRIQVFDKTGRFVLTLGMPLFPLRIPINLRLTQRGWLYPSQDHKSLLLSDLSFQKSESILGGALSKDIDAPHASKFNPAPKQLLFTVDAVKRRILVWKPDDGFQIRIFSMDTLEEKQRWTIPGKPVAFDKDWGRQALEQHRATMSQKSYGQEHYDADFPKFFPALSDMWALPTGEICLVSGNALLPSKQRFRYFSAELKPISKPTAGLGDTIVVAVDGPFYFLSYPKKDGQIAVEKIPKSEYLKALVQP